MKMQNGLRPALAVLAAMVLACGAQASSSAAASLEQGKRQWEEGKLEAAQKSFAEAVKADPRSVDAHMKLAGIQVSRLHYSAALATYRSALALDPNNAKAWMGMGMCYIHAGGREMARAAFEEALRAEPGRKQQLEPVLAELDAKIAAKRAQLAAAMPDDKNHPGKAALPTGKSHKGEEK